MEYHSHKFEDYSLIIKDQDRVVALLPANLSSFNSIVSHQGLSYGGFIFRREETICTCLSIIREALKYLSENGIKNLIYKVIPDYYYTIPSNEIEYALFVLETKLLRRDTSSVIFQEAKLPYQERRIRSIKKASKFSVIVKEEHNFDFFWSEILIPNLEVKFNLKPVHSVEEITLLKTKFPQNIRQFNTYLEGKLVAGTTIFDNPTVAHAQYIASNVEGKDSGAIDFLFDHLISKVFPNKKYFSFGISNTDEGRNVNWGLMEWKESFGARAMKHDFYEIKTDNYFLLDRVIGL